MLSWCKKNSLPAKYHFSDILGHSPAVQKAIRLAQYYSGTDETILIFGESGTGKELFAQSIHNASRRRQSPFVAVNCAAIPDTLIESELFGYEEGAFTGARKGESRASFKPPITAPFFLMKLATFPSLFKVASTGSGRAGSDAGWLHQCDPY